MSAYGLADLAVQAFDRVGRVDDSPHGDRKGEERNNLFPVAPPTAGDRRILRSPRAGVKFFQPRRGGRGRGAIAGLEAAAIALRSFHEANCIE